MMSVDPVDDCTFYFTSEYLQVTEQRLVAHAYRRLQVPVLWPGARPTTASAATTATSAATSAASAGAHVLDHDWRPARSLRERPTSASTATTASAR